MRAILAILLVFSLAGCAENVEPEPEPVEAPAPAPEPKPASVPVAIEPEAPELTGVTKFYWKTDGDGSPTAISITVDVGESNGCLLARVSSGPSNEFGTNRVAITERSTGNSWSSSGSGETVYAHADDVDTRTESTGGGAGRSISFSSGPLSGEVTFTMISRSMQTVDGAGEPWIAAGVAVECEKPFDVLGGLIGHELHFADFERMDGTAGAGTGRADVGLGLNWTGVVQNGSARMILAGFGQQVVDGTISTPGGSHEISIAAENYFESWQAGAGEYSVQVDWLATNFYSSWGVLYTFSEQLDLAAGMQDESPVGPSPF